MPKMSRMQMQTIKHVKNQKTTSKDEKEQSLDYNYSTKHEEMLRWTDKQLL